MRAFSFAASARSFGILASNKFSFPASGGGKPPEAYKIVTVRRFMLGGRHRERGLEEKALEHVLKGLKLQGVKKVLITAGAAREDAAELFLSLGFRPAGEGGCDGLCYELEM